MASTVVGVDSAWWPATRRCPVSEAALRPAPGHIEADVPGELVQFDFFHIGRLCGTRGRVWQYTAIDVASSFTWAELHVTSLNPAARFTSALVRRVAAERAAADRSQAFRAAVAATQCRPGLHR
jgi:hypothetical protein